MRIENIELIEINNWVKIKADVVWGENNQKEVFYAVPKQFRNRLDGEFADNFIVGLLLLAVNHNENIIINNAKVSPTLKNNIETKLIPILAQMKCGNNKTRIIANKDNSVDQQRGQDAGTGISLGVDSFYSILQYKNDKKMPVKCVLYIKQITSLPWKIDNFTYEGINKRKEAADKLGLEFIPMLSNLRSIVDTEFVFSQYHTFAHLSAALTIKSVGCYYYATGFSEHEMQLCLNDTAYYDNHIQNSIKHKNFVMKMAGENVTRFEKTQIIKDNKVVQDYLEVCLYPLISENRVDNCTKCHKCNRTLTTLEVLDSLSEFDSVFNLDFYVKNRGRAWGEVEYGKIIMKDEFSIEISRKAMEAKVDLPLSRWYFFVMIGIRNQLNKLFK